VLNSGEKLTSTKNFVKMPEEIVLVSRRLEERSGFCEERRLIQTLLSQFCRRPAKEDMLGTRKEEKTAELQRKNLSVAPTSEIV
jgi:hypothetical protein